MKSILIVVSLLVLSSVSTAQVTSPYQPQPQIQAEAWRKIETGQSLIVAGIVHMGGTILRARTSQVLLRSEDMGETWQTVNDPFGGDTSFGGVQFFDDSLGYSSSRSTPWLYKTTNGGTSWPSRKHTLMSKVWGFHMFDTVRGVAWSQGQIAQTQNAGNWWRVTESLSLRNIDFADHLHGFAIGDPHPWKADPPIPDAPHFSRTTDGGRSWVDVYPRWPNMWWQIVAMSPERLLVVADRYIFASNDSGNNWTPTHQAQQGQLYHSMSRDSNGTLYLCGSPGLLMRSTDSGDSWVRIEVPASGILTYATFIDSLTGFFSGQDGLFKTTTGGKSWVERPIGSQITKLSISPNPAADHCQIDLVLRESTEIAIAVYDHLGNTRVNVRHETLPHGNNTVTLDVSSLPSGSYFVRLSGTSIEEEVALTIIR